MRNMYNYKLSTCTCTMACNHCIRSECILIDVCFVVHVIQEPQGKQSCVLMHGILLGKYDMINK